MWRAAIGSLWTVAGPFIQAIFTDNILRARSCARSGARSAEKKNKKKNRQIPGSHITPGCPSSSDSCIEGLPRERNGSLTAKMLKADSSARKEARKFPVDNASVTMTECSVSSLCPCRSSLTLLLPAVFQDSLTHMDSSNEPLCLPASSWLQFRQWDMGWKD